MTSFMTTYGEISKDTFYVIDLTPRLVFEQSALEKPFTSETAGLFCPVFLCISRQSKGILTYLLTYLRVLTVLLHGAESLRS